MRCSSTRKLSQLPSCSFSAPGALVCPDNAVRDRDVFIDNDLGAATHTRSANCHAVSPHSTSFVTVDTSPTTASVPWWCRLYTQDSTTPTLSRSGFQHTYRGALSLFSTLRLVWCFALVVTIMSRTPLQLCIGCVYHNESTSRWPSWHFVCCMVSLHRT